MPKPDFDDPGIPFERHGEMGTLFWPKVQLTVDELIFRSKVETACMRLNRESLERDELLAVIEKIREENNYSLAMRDKVIASYDELFLRAGPFTGRQ